MQAIMTNNNWKRMLLHFSSNSKIYIALVLLIVIFSISIQFPSYFRSDGVEHIYKVYNYNNPLDVFEPYRGHIRPMVQLGWWTMYSLFGLNSYLYHIVILSMYVLSFFIFFKLVELIFTKRIAIFSLIAYFAVFFWLTYIPFFFANLTYLLNMFFTNLSLFFLIHAIKEKRSYLWGFFFYICASLSKEPSLVIVPSVTTAFLLTNWEGITEKKRKQVVWLVGVLWTVGITGVVSSPLKGSSLTVSLDTYNFIMQRWDYYAGYLMSKSGILICISTFYLAYKSLSSKKYSTVFMNCYFPLILCIALSIVLIRFPSAALLVLLIACIPMLIKRLKESIPIVWFLLAILGFMIIEYTNRTYLTDASFGIAIIVGIALSDIISNLEQEKNRFSLKYANALLIIPIVIVCSGFIMFYPMIKERFDALHVVSANRTNFKKVIDFVSDNLNDPDTQIVFLDLADMGLNYMDDIFPLDIKEKAHRQKGLASENVQRLLVVARKKNISVNNLTTFTSKEQKPDKYYLLAMNNYEQNFIDQLNVNKSILHEEERAGEKATIYYVVNR